MTMANTFFLAWGFSKYELMILGFCSCSVIFVGLIVAAFFIWRSMSKRYK